MYGLSMGSVTGWPAGSFVPLLQEASTFGCVDHTVTGQPVAGAYTAGHKYGSTEGWPNGNGVPALMRLSIFGWPAGMYDLRSGSVTGCPFGSFVRLLTDASTDGCVGDTCTGQPSAPM